MDITYYNQIFFNIILDAKIEKVCICKQTRVGGMGYIT